MPGNFAQIPASVILSWPMPNYVDPIRRTWMPAFCVIWQMASTAVLIPRIFLRAKKEAGSFGVDDICIVIGWLFSIGFTTTAWLSVESYGEDRHTWDVPPSLWVGAALTGWIAQVIFVFSTVATKLSVMLLYRRLVPSELAIRWAYAIYAAIFVTAGYGVGFFITYCFICQPLEAYWMSYDFSWGKEYKCINGNALIISSCAFSTVSDFYAVALPCALVRKYNPNVSRSQKIALNVLFAMGLLVTGVGVGRTYAFWQVSNAYDTSWNGFELFAWAMVEIHLSVICACAPSLRIFIIHYILRKPSHTRFQRVGSFTRDSLGQGRSRKLEEIEPGLGSPGSNLSSPINAHLNVEEVEITQVTLPAKAQSSAGKRVTTADEYEMYAVAQTNRHTRTFS